MNPLAITALFDIGGKLIEKLFPDPQKAAEAKLKMFELQQAGEFKQLEADVQLALAQIDVNKEEAKGDLFRAGWRPFIGWVCGGALAYQFILRPILPWLSINLGFEVTLMPALETETLMTLLFGMLGLGAYRSYEKVNGFK